MSLLIMIRHGLTEWNIDHRLQGHADLPLSDDGRRQVQSWRLPDKFLRYRWLTSPLRRAVETATLLKGEAPPADERLKEMSWGRWEGYTVDDLRAELGDAMRENEMRALDFQPPEGESPRQVQTRLWPLLDEIFVAGDPVVAVTHKGVMRAVYAEAVGWNMLGKPPHKMEDGVAQVYEIGPGGRPLRLAEIIELEAAE
jgi:broad specificity phosphatase PhoE